MNVFMNEYCYFRKIGFSVNSIHTICFSWCQHGKPVHENKQMGSEGLLLSAVQLFGLLSSYMPKIT